MASGKQSGIHGESDSGVWIASGGEIGARIGAFDWSNTALGPMESWPQSLTTTVRLLLNSRYPIRLVGTRSD